MHLKYHFLNKVLKEYPRVYFTSDSVFSISVYTYVSLLFQLYMFTIY